MRYRFACLFLGLALVGGAACDDSYASFLDAVPIPDQQHQTVDVYLAVDGLSREAFDLARGRGAFATYADGDFITPFPGTSDYAWTRILRTGSLPGYEIQHFDPQRNRMEKKGLTGVVEHPVREGLAGSFACYGKFDFLGDGYLWMARGYSDPEAALPGTLDALFATLLRRTRQTPTFLAYLLNVDVIGHKGGLDKSVAALVEVDRRIQEFKRRHPGKFRFTLFGDHGNAHRKARLVDPVAMLREVGIDPVESLAPSPVTVEAVPVVHVRVTYVSLHTSLALAAEVARRASSHRDVDLAVAALASPGEELQGRRFGIWRQGQGFFFWRRGDGSLVFEEPARFAALGVALPGADRTGGQALVLSDAEARAATADGPYPDLFYRVATAFTHPAARFPANVLLSLPEDVASFGFHVPGSGDGVAIDGFHGGLGRGGSVSVLASEAMIPAGSVRADDLLTLFPALGERR
jgi:hypothetical protein